MACATRERTSNFCWVFFMVIQGYWGKGTGSLHANQDPDFVKRAATGCLRCSARRTLPGVQVHRRGGNAGPTETHGLIARLSNAFF
jgi:hypothetical protein